MLNIDRSIIQNLGFDLDAALKLFSEEKRLHAFSVNVAAPTAHPLVEAAFAAGGFQAIESPPVVEAPSPTPPANPLDKVAALERLAKIQGKSASAQIDEIRAILIQMFENMPG